MIKLILIALAPAFLVSCIHEKLGNCGVYLEFIYDYNMEYADSFDPHVEVVDVYVFDTDGKYLFTKHATRSELIEGKKMLLKDDLPLGTYKILTVGGLCEHFAFADMDGADCVAGTTMLEEMHLALQRQSDQVSHEFPDLWYGETVVVNYESSFTTWPVRLVKNTNNFNVTLAKVDSKADSRANPRQYTFEITTPEAAVYRFDNSPARKETVTYLPHTLLHGNPTADVSTGYLNTLRLIDDSDYPYRIALRDANTSQLLWDYDLMDLLLRTKPPRPDGSNLPMQEYLDRQSQWNIVVLYSEGTEGDPDSFMAVGVRVNNWLLWFHDIDV